MKAVVHVPALYDEVTNEYGVTFLWQKQVPEKPIGGLLDKRFVYVPAVKTDVAATIARVRAEIANGERKL